ncbi:helix-turn-helix domain-containing protein [Sutterella sp.]|uniref:winged helix-turn-helix transcriptional regulator n=1 Tax=Sutterella sp. TaxID=1981025 RepID=UPI0026E02CE7|nr:helix-turn-helix domain-containing protein [Sutterella sp.]MDO5532998.1 helix-turn-helix domain-containing protein [Sutterella sp.]
MPQLKDEYSCSLLLAMDLIGGKWKLRILWHILDGATRFSSLKRTMPDITEKMLATQLNDLEANGILTRTVVSAKPLHIEYAFAPGQELLVSAVSDLCDFSKIYAKAHGIRVPDTSDGCSSCCSSGAPSCCGSAEPVSCCSSSQSSSCCGAAAEEKAGDGPDRA